MKIMIHKNLVPDFVRHMTTRHDYTIGIGGEGSGDWCTLESDVFSLDDIITTLQDNYDLPIEVEVKVSLGLFEQIEKER